MIPRPDWWDDAACRGLGPFLFFGPDDRESIAQRRRREINAKRHCEACEVRVDCLADALRFNDEGIRGGLTRYERGQLAPRRRPTVGWMLVANSTGIKGHSRLERAADADNWRVVRHDVVILETTDESEAWIALHRSDL